MSNLNALFLAAPAGPAGWVNIAFFAVIGVVFYFFIIRPQSQKQKKQSEFSGGLQKGDQVVTTGGLFGKIVSVDNETVTIEIDKSIKMKFLRSSISLENTNAAFPVKNADSSVKKTAEKETVA